MLDTAIALLRCPHCTAALARDGTAVRCAAGHAFDLARHGYLSLLAGAPRPPAGDTAAMVAAREAFLGAGHYAPIAQAVAETAAAGPSEGCVVDLGAGTGAYLAATLELLPGRIGLALDVSKPALRRAARAHPRAAAVACDAWRALPLRDGVAGAVLSVFAPRNGPEIARVLAPGGVIAVAAPTRRHLAELTEPLGLIGIDDRKHERLARRFGADLVAGERREREWAMTLDRAAVAAVAGMGPSAFHAGGERRRARIAALPEPVTVTASVTVTAYRRR